MNAPSSLITIVIPVYNRATIVERTLNSVHAQNCRPINLIIVDNNSYDDSLRIINEWADSHRSDDFSVTVISETNLQSAAAARNKGLKSVKTPYVMFFDSDDTMRPSHVARAAKAFHDDPELDIAGWDVVYHAIDGHTEIRPFADKNAIFRHTFNATLSTQRYAVSTALINAIGGWDTTVRGWDDYVLGMKLLERSPKMHKLSGDFTVDVFETEASITGTDYSSKSDQWEYALSICKSIFQRNNWNRNWITLRYVILAALYKREKSPKAKRLLSAIMQKEPSQYLRSMYKFAYHYTRLGFRGIHILLQPFI